MDKEGIFWIKWWSITASVFVTCLLIVAVWNHFNSERYTMMWIDCVGAGGQPIYQPMVGSNSTTFTCVRP